MGMETNLMGPALIPYVWIPHPPDRIERVNPVVEELRPWEQYNLSNGVEAGLQTTRNKIII